MVLGWPSFSVCLVSSLSVFVVVVGSCSPSVFGWFGALLSFSLWVPSLSVWLGALLFYSCLGVWGPSAHFLSEMVGAITLLSVSEWWGGLALPPVSGHEGF